ncbi:hypothetical protein AIT99_004506, partial [Salmonella enterica subsp. indica]|nr:hypothetical protein [Salmonella enterica subsp. indica]
GINTVTAHVVSILTRPQVPVMLPILPFLQVVEDEPLHERLKVKWALLSPQTIDVEALTINEKNRFITRCTL